MNFKLYKDNGLKADRKNIHRVLRFKQARYMKPFIDSCTARRAAAKTTNEANTIKLCANAAYGKTLENQRGRMKVQLTHNPKVVKRLAANPRYHSHRILNPSTVAVYSKDSLVLIDKPLIVGAVTLEWSKWEMQRRYYNELTKACNGVSPPVVMSDTDSFCLHVQDATLERVLDHLTPIMDFSNYPDNHPRKNDTNKRKPFFFKNECSGEYAIVEAVSVRSKVYALRTRPTPFSKKHTCAHITKPAHRPPPPSPPSPLRCGGEGGARGKWWKEGGRRRSHLAAARCSATMCVCASADAFGGTDAAVKKVCKGVARAAIRHSLRFDMYKSCVLDGRRHHASAQAIRNNKKLGLVTVTQNKVALSNTDCKRYYLPCGIHSHPFGSVAIKLDNGICRLCPLSAQPEHLRGVLSD